MLEVVTIDLQTKFHWKVQEAEGRDCSVRCHGDDWMPKAACYDTGDDGASLMAPVQNCCNLARMPMIDCGGL